MTYRFFTPAPAKAATGLTADVLLAAFAPGAISAGDVALWRLSRPADADLVRLVAYGAVMATNHVARALTPTHR